MCKGLVRPRVVEGLLFFFQGWGAAEDDGAGGWVSVWVFGAGEEGKVWWWRAIGAGTDNNRDQQT